MAQKACIICGTHFEPQGNGKTCSRECSHERRKATKSEHGKTYRAKHPEKLAEYKRRWSKRRPKRRKLRFRSCAYCGRCFIQTMNHVTCSETCRIARKKEQWEVSHKIWLAANPERRKEHLRRYVDENRDTIRKRFTEWARNNPERVRASAYKFYHKHRERLLANRLKDRLVNPEVYKQKAMATQARRKAREQLFDTNFATYNMENPR